VDPNQVGQRVAQQQYPCANCGANVEFAPGTAVLRCPYCGHETALVATGQAVREHSFAEFVGLPRKPVASLGAHVFHCRGCGAETQSDAISARCQFCGAPVVADVSVTEQVAPEAVLPFVVDKRALRAALQKWVSSRWFAPSGLRKVVEAESSRSTYLPHWTFDARTESRYDGERGEHYWETETYTETVNGETQTRTRQVQRTRWYPAGGEVQRDFDDVLVVGTTHVQAKHLDALEPWPLPAVEPYRPEYLAGHETLRYDVEPETGLGTAKTVMAAVITGDCERDIGGDEQRVHSVDTAYDDVRFKLLLLPVWIACYLHAGKTFTVMVNGRTGEVAGERPYSAAKITAAVLAGVALIALIVLLVMMT
jgi:DNA-directed RNA polymerase subunit RPC12/RpoP